MGFLKRFLYVLASVVVCPALFLLVFVEAGVCVIGAVIALVLQASYSTISIPVGYIFAIDDKKISIDFLEKYKSIIYPCRSPWGCFYFVDLQTYWGLLGKNLRGAE